MRARQDEPAIDPSPRGDWFGHPRGLFILFLTEMWERFSFYGMRALLIVYLIQHFLVAPASAYAHFAAYAALVYLGSLVGGALADRYLGFRKAVAFGGILLTIGHCLMALDDAHPSRSFLETAGGQRYELVLNTDRESRAKPVAIITGGKPHAIIADRSLKSAGHPLDRITYRDDTGRSHSITGRQLVSRDALTYNLLYIALSFIIVGVGLMKSNISTLVGKLYAENDVRRDRGFTIFYMGINIGAFLSSSICGYLGITYGWRYGFGLAGVGMALGLTIFLKGQGTFAGRAEPPNPAWLKKTLLLPGATRERIIYAVVLLLVAACAALLKHPELVSELLNSAGAGVILVLMLYGFIKLDRPARYDLLLISVIIFSAVACWTLMEQAPQSLNVFAAQFVTLNIGSHHIPAPVLQNLEPLFLILFALPLNRIWLSFEQRRVVLSPLTKISLGLAAMGIGYFALYAGARLNTANLSVGLAWIVFLYFAVAVSELCWGPIGISAVTRLSPHRITGFMVGCWFLAAAYGEKVAGSVAQLTVVETGSGAAAALARYGEVFFWLSLASVTLAMGLVIANLLFRRLKLKPP